MALRDVRPFKKRGLGILVAGIGCSSLVALPVIGIARIDSATSDSHSYTRLVSDVDQLSSHLLQMLTGPLAVFGQSNTPETRAAAIHDLETARAKVATVVAQADVAKKVGIEDPVKAHLARATVMLDAADKYVTEIDGGATVATAPSTAAVVGAAGEILTSQGSLGLAMTPARLRLDQERRDTVREAQILLFAAAAVALATLGTLVFLDSRKVQAVFAGEEARRETAERLAAHRADVVNMASHELRNPLTVLTLSTDLMARAASDRRDTQLGELASDAHAAALRCEALVNELLDLGRLDADRLQLRVGATPLMPALQDAIVMSESHHGAHPMHIQGLREISVHADPDRLRVILRNLVDNAYKYSPAGSDVYVSIREWEGRVRVDVQDQGQGVPEQYRERIFQRFERLTSTDHVSGVGIGLYLSRELARRMNGDLKCSESEKGAAFCLELPAAAA